MDKFRFKHHVIDLSLPPGNYGQTLLADLDGDGIMEFITGQQFGSIFCYKFITPDKWERTEIAKSSPSDVGLCCFDVDGDGLPDLVTGGAWYRNPGSLHKEWEKIVFDGELAGVHDIICGDINRDGRNEVITMSDRNDLRWYRIPDNPRNSWEKKYISPPVHAGISLGDIDGSGNLSIIRTDRCFKNINGDASAWGIHYIGPNSMPPVDFQPRYAFDGTINRVCDINGDGINDIVFTDAEIPGGKIWWMENVAGDGTIWQRHDIFSPVPGQPRRGALHSLVAIDIDRDGDIDLITAEMEGVPGEKPPKYYIYENVKGNGSEWVEHVILDINLGGHELVAGDIRGNGKIDIMSKPWSPSPNNQVGGKVFVIYLENISD